MAVQPFTKVPRSVSSGAVAILEEWLARAKAGEIIEVSLVGICADSKYAIAGSDSSNHLQLAGLYMKQVMRILEKDG